MSGADISDKNGSSRGPVALPELYTGRGMECPEEGASTQIRERSIHAPRAVGVETAPFSRIDVFNEAGRSGDCGAGRGQH
jgi:hypothetical protein